MIKSNFTTFCSTVCGFLCTIQVIFGQFKIFSCFLLGASLNVSSIFFQWTNSLPQISNSNASWKLSHGGRGRKVILILSIQVLWLFCWQWTFNYLIFFCPFIHFSNKNFIRHCYVPNMWQTCCVTDPVLNTENRKKKIKCMRFLSMQLKLKLLICVLTTKFSLIL